MGASAAILCSALFVLRPALAFPGMGRGAGHADAALAASGEADVAGRVANFSLSDEGAPMPRQKVVFQRHEWRADGAIGEAERREAEADAQGQFVFRRVAYGPHTFFTVATEHMGVRYVSDPVFPAEGMPEGIELAVYDAKEGRPPLHAHMRHILLTFEKKTVFVSEMTLFMNPEKFTFTGAAGEPPLRLMLPKGAQDFKAQEGIPENAEPEGGVLSLFQPVRPGALQVAFDYMIPRAREIAVPVDMDTQRLAVFVAGTRTRVTGKGLSEPREVEFEGQKFTHLTGENLRAGEPLVLRVSEVWTTEQKLRYGALAVALVLALGGFFWTWKRMRAKPAAGSRPSPAAEDAKPAAAPPAAGSEKEEILRALAALDVRYEKGEISEKDWAEGRTALKDRLMRLLESGLN